MKLRSFWGNRRGVSLLETMFAVILISAVGIIIAELLKKNTINLTWNRQTRRAAALADMVLEKYDYLASVQFATLEQQNQTQTPVSSFFATGADNQGYDGMSITSVTDPAATDGSRKLTVTIGWGAQTASQTFTVTKYLTPGTGITGGAPVHVYVLDNNGVGIQGFEVRATHNYNPAYLNSVGTNEVIAFTDANGYAVLNNVSVAANVQPMAVYARQIGSDATIPHGSPNFVQGYYAGPSSMWSTKTLTVTQTSANNLTFDMRNNDFRKMARVYGTLTNTGGATLGMDITLVANATNGTKSRIDSQGQWDLITDNTGVYEFNNVAPGAVELQVHGQLGSDPTVPPGAGFQQGFVGFGGNGIHPWLYDPPPMSDPASDIIQNVQVHSLGSLVVTATSLVGGGLLPGATVSFTWPNIGLRHATPWQGNTDASGQIHLYNLFAENNLPIAYSATVAPNGCVNLGAYIHNFNVNSSAGISNPVNLVLNVGSSITGTVTNTSAVPLANMQVAVPGLNGITVQSVTDAGGSFTLCGISPDNTYIPGWPNVAFTLTDLSTNRVASTFSGTTVDNDFPSQMIPNVGVLPASNLTAAYVHNVPCASDPNPASGTSDTITSNALGNYGPVCAYIPFIGTVNKTVSGGPPTYTPGALAVNNTSMTEGLAINFVPYYNPNNNILAVSNGSVNSGFTLKGTLSEQSVSGVITDAGTSVALQGLSFDPCQGCHFHGGGGCPVTTDGGGHYGPVILCVSGRNSGSPGTVSMTVPNGLLASNTGKTYSGSTQSATIATPANPATALTVNFSLNRQSGGI